jgi:hypothetical protein
MKYEFKRTWKESAMAYIKILSQNLPGGTEENQKTSVKVADLRTEI